MANYDLLWNPNRLEQRVGRIHRLGQRLPIDVYNLVSQDCIESRIASLVSDKRALFQGLFDGSSDEIRFERSGSFLASIERIVAAARPPDLPETDERAGETSATGESEIEAVVSAADESADIVPVPMAAASIAAGVVPGALASEALPGAVEIRRLFSQLEIRPSERGGIRIEAPAEAAASLASLFEGLAQLLREGASAPRTS